MTFEIEIKLRLPEDLGAIRRALREHGFRVLHRRVHEHNAIFDTPKLALRSQRKVIRVRRVGANGVLTYKGPAEQGHYKKRPEIEVVLPETLKLEQIFNEIGYRPVFRYEKFRTEFAKPPGAGKVMLDETPIGNFLEIEGSPRWIDGTAKLLGFAAGDYITRSYGSLYLAHCREQRIKPTHMLFSERDMKLLRGNNSRG